MDDEMFEILMMATFWTEHDKSPLYLCNKTTDEIERFLFRWVVDRNDYYDGDRGNWARMTATAHALLILLSSHNDHLKTKRVNEVCEIKPLMINEWERLKEENVEGTLVADYLLDTLYFRGIDVGKETSCEDEYHIEADVCAHLNAIDESPYANEMCRILEFNKKKNIQDQWFAKLRDKAEEILEKIEKYPGLPGMGVRAPRADPLKKRRKEMKDFLAAWS